MWWPFRMLYEVVSYSLLDFVFFVVIDGIAKSPLKEARSEEEKKTIWMYESIILTAMCLVINILDHCPYVLIALTLATALYTQIFRQLDLRYWWHKFFEHWEEHEHHTDNVKAINEKRKQLEMWRKFTMQSPVSKPVMSRLSNFIYRRSEQKNDPQQTPMSPPEFPAFSKMVNLRKNRFDNPQFSSETATHIPASTAAFTSHQQVTQQNPVVQSGLSHNHVFTQMNPVYPQSNNNFVDPSNGFPQPGQTNPQDSRAFQQARATFSSYGNQTPVKVNNWFTRSDLRRRPLRNYDQRNISQSSFTSAQSGIRNKFMSAFGFSSYNSHKPPGLRNEGQNLCFMNCVIQCLSHTPNLVEKLISDANKDLDCSEAESVIIDALTNVMSQCKKTSNSEGVLDPTVFREAVSVLNNGLVTPLTERQHQQDAAEFFMWLMETLHRALNKKTVKEKRQKGTGLDTLEFIYKDLSDEKMENLKRACKEEINKANGLQNDTYAEPIQRLSDLEWLIYKQKNHSVIDDLFCGQLVEAYQCLNGNHLTVGMQTFNILPVPIETTRNFSGLVHLEDCFTKFCNIEHLVGPEGVDCEMCRKNSVGLNQMGFVVKASHGKHDSKPKTPQINSHLGSVDSAFQSSPMSTTYMSPIPGQTDALNDSGFQDNVFRTSTPVGERSTGRFIFPSRHVREAERRCLLRQLPECLVIQPLRFSYNQFTQQSRKIHTPISIPLKGLNLTTIVYDHVTNREDLSAGHPQHKYDLYAVCSHLGAESTNYGHYVCYCLAQNNIWYKFDDELVTEVNMDFEITTKEIRENAYLLFYKRADASATTT